MSKKVEKKDSKTNTTLKDTIKIEIPKASFLEAKLAIELIV